MTLSVRRVALLIDPAPSLLLPLAVGLAKAGYDLAFSTPSGADRRVLAVLRSLGRRGLPLDRSAGPDRIVDEVRNHFGRLDLVVVEPERARGGVVRGSTARSRERAPIVSPALGAARATLELLGASGGSIVRIVYAPGSGGGARLDPSEIAATRQLGHALGPKMRANAVAVPRGDGDGIGFDTHAASIVRTVLFLAGSRLLNGEVISLR
ncbi:MAG: hypothetical protein RQ745_00125 [Longimicrobiales bacterium]|nr:hypothetical protein [Longimicrobiales bacterium]